MELIFRLMADGRIVQVMQGNTCEIQNCVTDGRCSVASKVKDTGQRLFTAHMHTAQPCANTQTSLSCLLVEQWRH